MVVLYMQAATVAEHDERGIELSNLVQQEILDHEPYEIAFMVLDVLLALHHLRESLAQGG